MKSYDTKRIEEAATLAVKTALLRCPYLESYISENDRTPSWDGMVFVYADKSRNVNIGVRKVPVQIKGTIRKFSQEATYSCRVGDLRRYYNDGGCMLFLVSEDLDTGENVIFYSSMLAFDLKQILDNVGNRKSHTIHLGKFPANDPNEIAAVFFSFVDNFKKQLSFMGKEQYSLDDLKERGITVEALSFSVPNIRLNNFNIGQFLSSHDFYIYAKLRGLDIEIPVDKISKPTVSKIMSVPIKIKGTTYYDHYSIVYKNGTSIIQIGKGISIKLSTAGQSSTIDFKPTGTLSDFIRDATFMVDLIKQKEISIENIRIPLHDLSKIDTQKYSDSLAYYKDVKKMLDVLGVTEELDCKRLTEKDEVNLRILVSAVLYNKKICFPKLNDAIVHGPFKIANLSIWIWARRQENGSYAIENYFAPHSVVAFEKDDSKKEHPLTVSHFILLDKAAFISASNIDYQVIEADLLSTNLAACMIDKATFLLLEMLRGYDELEHKRPELLTLAEKTCEWIATSNAGANTEIVTLNKLQIIKRKRKLSVSEILELAKLIDNTQSPNILCGAYLLLDDNESAQKYFDKIEPQDKEEFLTYPICHFGTLVLN